VLDRTSQEAGSAALKSAQARYAAYAARACGYAFESLDGEDGYLFEVRDDARRAVFAAGAGTPYALNDARAASIARDKAFCAEVLRRAGVPVLPGEMFFVTKRWSEMRRAGREPEDALAYAERAAYPIFCKPISASNGLYAELIENADAFADYMARVAREHFAILIQPYVRADEYRVFVLEGCALFSYRKSAPHVVGDGASTLQVLIEAMPRDPHEPVRKLHGRDGAGQRVELDGVPAKRQHVGLEGPANRAAGGGAQALADGAPQPMAELAINAAKALDLKLAAVDMFDLGDDAVTVIEVNSNPMIATLEDHGRWDLIETIWRANFAAALK
jgi:glutathione synthase/RimK-type ligase-like ATP-grasp enzyme